MAFIGTTKTSLGLMCLQPLCLIFIAFLPCTFLSVLGDSMRTEIFRQQLHHLKFSRGSPFDPMKGITTQRAV
jgi:hypothetical protein